MGDNEELRRRVEALEAQVNQVVEQLTTTQNLAVGSDPMWPRFRYSDAPTCR